MTEQVFRPAIETILATEIDCRQQQVEAAIALLDSGATVPFIARYRKEVTGGLDDSQLRTLETRLAYLRELEDRRATLLENLAAQNQLSPALRKEILAADNKTRLEDLYLPFRPKRRTKAQIAREAGLGPLAETLLAEHHDALETLANAYLNPDCGIDSPQAALEGARQILMEHLAENADLLQQLRTWLWENALLCSEVQADQEKEESKFRDYFNHSEALATIPSHRTLALFRGRKEGVLRIRLALPEILENADPHPGIAMISRAADAQKHPPATAAWLQETWRWTWRVKLLPHLETALLGQVRASAEQEAITVFSRNLKALLLAPPAGMRTTLGLDPGLRTGVKVVVIGPTGMLLEFTTVFPHAPHKRWDQALAELTRLCRKHKVELIAIGNGTASRETDRLAAEILHNIPEQSLHKVIVNEAGASIYSASELAAKEFPDLDVTYRGAVSIARRLQDPLAELVKINPSSIGVGQYQHDVSPSQLANSLDAVVEDCVNAVGVDLNTASASLLTHVAGLNSTLAHALVRYREENGAFASRKALYNVPRLGNKTFEQAAGFLRIRAGAHPLDASAVHPEAYSVVERIATRQQRQINDLIGDAPFLRRLNPADYVCERFGEPTVRDILLELEKPGRDPRPEFRAAQLREGVEDLKDLVVGMILEGTVTNVTHFGAFVDLGVHQDGLVHISALADRFVKDPHEIVAPGDIIRVKVMEVDVKRRRIALSCRLQDTPEPNTHSPQGTAGKKPQPPAKPSSPTRRSSRATSGRKTPESRTGTLASLLTEAQTEAIRRKPDKR